ncbi:MAG TPA: hypothetical protein VJ739_11365 [Gemmataceae bacterium]|nr:hypothetical protein [Gemmataceae bacterium]
MVTRDDSPLPREDRWVAWPVSWSAVWVGALTALAVLVLIGLIAVAVGAHEVGPSDRVLSWREFGLLALVFSVGGAFFAFVAGGWVAARVAGIRRAEPAMLHGAIAWLVAVPLLVVAAALGGSHVLGTWYGGLAGTPSWAAAPVPKATATADTNKTPEQEAKDAARAARNAALGALTALILGLVGSVLGGWMASGEPMAFGHYWSTATPGAREPVGTHAVTRT